VSSVIRVAKSLCRPRDAVYPITAPPRSCLVQPVIAATRLVGRWARGAELRDVN
jgi:hypothetical protein